MFFFIILFRRRCRRQCLHYVSTKLHVQWLVLDEMKMKQCHLGLCDCVRLMKSQQSRFVSSAKETTRRNDKQFSSSKIKQKILIMKFCAEFSMFFWLWFRLTDKFHSVLCLCVSFRNSKMIQKKKAKTVKLLTIVTGFVVVISAKVGIKRHRMFSYSNVNIADCV